MVDLLIGLFIASLIISLFTTRLYGLFLWYSVNSLMLGILALIIGVELDDKAMIVAGIITILMKGVGIPFTLKYFSQKFNFIRQITPIIKIYHLIILVPTILVFTFYLADPITNMIHSNTHYVAISISSLFLALLLIMEHRHAGPKIIGFLMMENALFLLGITATEGMPMLVELGIFFDLLMAIVIINLLFHREELNA